MGGKSSAPPPPDYAAAANATAAGNLDAARAAASANRVNQNTPYGSLTYSQTPTYGPDGKLNPDAGWTATQTLSPAQQQILNQNNQLSSGLLDTAQQGLNYAGGLMSHPGVDMSQLPAVGINPGQTYQDAIMQRLQPNLDMQNQMSDAQLANQGVMAGSQAYDNAKRQLYQSQNDQRAAAVTQGFQTGLAANQNAFNQTAYNQMQPVNVINALRTGSQVSTPSYVNNAQQATTQGPDLLNAAQQQYNAQVGNVNAQNAQSSNTMNGIASVAGTAALLF